MFVSSPYSPFFNSGLLARANTPGSTRRSSLPDSTTPRTSSSRKSTSAYYLSLQRRDHRELRSFLSLDLADSRLSDRYGPHTALIPPVPALPPLTLPVVSPLRSHFSSSNSLRSESIRSLPLPNPNPAPSIMLPDPPPPPYSIHHTHKKTPPRLPELPVLPALQFPPTYTKTRPHPQRPLPDPPSPVSPSPISNKLSPTDDDDPSPPLPRSSVLTKPRHLRSKKPKNLGIVTDKLTLNRLSKASVSTASTRVRRKNRWDALDALEGRRKPSITDDFIPPVPTPKRNIKLENIFVKPTTFKPTTFARPAKPLPRPIPKSNPKSPNFMSMSDDDESDHKPTTHPHVYLNQNLPLDISDPLLEPEDIVLPAPLRPRPPSAEINTRSYLDVDGDNDEEEEEGIILEATRCPALLSPPPPILTPIPPNSNQRPWISRVKGPVERPPLKPQPSLAKNDNISTMNRTKPSASSSSNHYHHHSSSRRHKPSTSTATPRPNPHPRNNHSHYKSFIELDMDDLLDQEVDEKDLVVKPTAALRPRKRAEDPEAGVELFEWRGRVGRGIAEGGGDWVWV